MKHHRNRGLLLLFCLGSTLLLPADPILICCFLTGVLFTGLNDYLNHRFFRYVSILFINILCLIQADFLLLLPFVLYETVLLLQTADGAKQTADGSGRTVSISNS